MVEWQRTQKYAFNKGKDRRRAANPQTKGKN